MGKKDEQPTTATSLRGMLERLLAAERPDASFDDDATFYGQILDDYADYARLLTDEHERIDRRAAADRAMQEAMESLKEQFGEEQLGRAMAFLQSASGMLSQGAITADAIGTALKALNYDADMADAELRWSKSQAIEPQPHASDGLPHLGGVAQSCAPQFTSIFDMAQGA